MTTATWWPLQHDDHCNMMSAVLQCPTPTASMNGLCCNYIRGLVTSLCDNIDCGLLEVVTHATSVSSAMDECIHTRLHSQSCISIIGNKCWSASLTSLCTCVKSWGVVWEGKIQHASPCAIHPWIFSWCMPGFQAGAWLDTCNFSCMWGSICPKGQKRGNKGR